MKIVKQGIKKKDWNEYYSRNSSYFYLEVKDGLVWAAFIVETIPEGAEELNDNELRLYDDYRRRNNIRPFPLTGDNDDHMNPMRVRSTQEKEENRGALDKFREEMGYKKKMTANLTT